MLQSGIDIGPRFAFKSLWDESARGRQAVVTRVLSNREGGSEVGFYIANWVEAHEVPEAQPATTELVFGRGTDGNVYLDGRAVSITLLPQSSSACDSVVERTDDGSKNS
jgi:hypothetical protein